MAAAARDREEDLPSKLAQGSEEVDTTNRKQDVAGPVSVNTDPAGRKDFHPKGESVGLLLGHGDAQALPQQDPSRQELGVPQETNRPRVQCTGRSQVQPLHHKWRVERLQLLRSEQL